MSSNKGTWVIGVAVATLVLAGPSALQAQDTGSAMIGNATLSVGAGTARIFLPDVEFFELQNAAFDTVQQLETHDSDDEYGFSVNGELAIPTQGRAGWGETVAVRGFYANVDSDDSRTCTSSAATRCGFSPIIDNTVAPKVQAVPGATLTSTSSRDIDHWGVAVEARRHMGGYGGLKDGPVAKPGYFAIGADIRAIQQDIDVTGAIAGTTSVTYSEDLDTHYYGVYAAYGRDYKLPIFGSMTSGWGLQSSFRVWGGVYYADTDYDGRYNDPVNAVTQNLSLSEDDVAFIGGITLETRKQIGPRATLSLKSDYEYYSWVPDMEYNDVVTGAACGAGNTCRGPNVGTRIDNDDAFAMRTTLNLKIKLGPRDVVQTYK